MDGNNTADGLHLIQIPTGLFQRLRRRLGVARPMGADEIHFDIEEVMPKFVRIDVAAVGGGHQQ